MGMDGNVLFNFILQDCIVSSKIEFFNRKK